MAPTVRFAPSVRALLRSFALLFFFVLCLSGHALAQSTATYHLHKEASTASSGPLQLKTAGPDAASFAVTTANLKNVAAGEYAIKAFETQAGVPNLTGVIRAGSAITLSLYLRKTGSSGVVYPRVKLYLNGTSGALLCNVTGTTALTTTVTKYTLTATTSADVSMAAGDRFYVWTGVNVSTAPTANTYGELSVEGTLNGNYDSQVVVPLPNNAPVLDGVSPTSGVVGAQVVLSGWNFGSVQGASAVTFNGVAASVSSWSNTSITTAVPAGATTGPVVVTARGLASGGAPFTVVPKINSLTPTSGVRGSSVTVSGTSFGATQGTSTLTFNGVAATPTSWGATTIVAPVPPTATSGPVVVTAGGSVSNGVVYQVVTTGALQGALTRTSDNGAVEGAAVEAIQAGVVKATAASASDGTYMINGVEEGTYQLRVTAPGCQTATRDGVVVTAGSSRTENFLLNNVGSLSGRVTGTDGVTAVAGASLKLYTGSTLVASASTDAAGNYGFNSVAGGNYTVEASAGGFLGGSKPALVTGGVDTAVNFSINIVSGGPVSYVYDELGRLVSASTPAETAVYKYDAVGNLLSIERRSSSLVSVTEFTPDGGAPGTPVTIYGTGFSATPGENTVAFNGTAAAVTSATAGEIRTSVPAGATSGVIAVTTPAGSATSAAPFVVSSAGGTPSITGFTPTIGPAGTVVTVSGSNFETIATNNRVKVNQTGATVTSAAPDTLVATVANGSGSGRVSVATPAGTAVSAADFYVTPAPYTAANVETTGRMALNQSRGVSVTTADKVGLVIFDAAAGQNMSLRVTGSSIASGYVTIYRPDGTYLNSTYFGTSDTFIDATYLPQTGTYTMLVDPSGANTGGVTLNLYEVVHVTGTIAPGSAAVATTVSTPGQNVALSFNGAAGQRVSLKVTGNTYGYVMWDSLDAKIVAPGGAVLGYVSLNTTASSVFLDTVTLPATGTYTVTLDPPLIRTGSATFTLYDVVDVTDSITPGGPTVTRSNTVPGQNVRLTFQGAAGQKVSVISSESGMSGSVRYVILRTDGSALSANGYGFIDATTLPAAGTYTVLCDPNLGDVGSMTVTLYNVVDVTGEVPLSGPPVDVSLSTPGQNLAMTFQGTAGQKITLTLTNNWFGFFWYANTYLNVKKPDGSVLAQLDVNAGAGPIYLDATTLPATGTYSLTLDPSDRRTGGFQMSLNEVVDVTGAIVPDGVAVTKTTSAAGQNIRLTFDGSAGQKVSLSAAISGFSGWPRLYILRPDGTVLIGPGNSSLGPVTLPAAGTYTVLADPYDMQTGTETFTLTNVP